MSETSWIPQGRPLESDRLVRMAPPCIESKRTPNRKYPLMSIYTNGKARHWREHRRVFHQAWGAIPRGAIICHVCDNTRCVNLLHLYAGVTKDNARDREVRGRSRRNQTHCIRGHLFDEANTHWTPASGRHCRACERGRKRALVPGPAPPAPNTPCRHGHIRDEANAYWSGTSWRCRACNAAKARRGRARERA